MRNLMPRFIHEQFERQIYSGRFEATTMFVDISGFTPLTETLMQHRRDGAEELTRVLNGIFNPLVAEVYARGGFISTFAGDAFTALFPLTAGEDAPLRALETAFFVQRFFAREGQVQTKYGRFDTGVRVGLSLGPVEWGILGAGERHTYFFRGQAIDACAQAEHHAQTGEVIADVAIWPLIQARARAAPGEAHFRLAVPPSASPLPRSPAPQVLDREALTPFVLDAAIELAFSGASAEFREVASVFISFDEPQSPGDLNVFAAAVLELAADYGGYFNKMDFGDKGGLMLVLFGAPVAHENDLARAAGFVLALQDRESGMEWRAGLTYGTVYAGIIGGAERCEYTAIGDEVNLSARLMQAAEWGQVWTSAPVVEGLRGQYRAEPLGEFTFKGKKGAQPVYRLAGREVLAEAWMYTGEMVGREAELTQLTRFVRPIFEDRFAGVVYVYGGAGMGKSRLVYELRRRVAPVSPPRAGMTEGGVSWFTCPADEILRQPLNPFKHFLRRYFDQSPDDLVGENKARFDQVLNTLIADLQGRGLSEVERELDRTRSFLGALVDLHWEGSLYEQLEPKLRFENTLAAFKTLVKAESVRRPVVLQLEDLQWLDDDSGALLKLLTRNVEAYPMAIVCTSRYRDDGSRVTLEVDEDVPQQVVELDTLTAGGIRAFAAQMLGVGRDDPGGRPITDELAAFLGEKTGGNPFFVEQLVLDLRERGAVVGVEGEWGLEAQETAEVPATISAVLIARLDRLVAQVRQVVQTAAVLGREFEVRVLSQVLRRDLQVTVRVKQAEAERVWTALSEMRYLFRHALMRDAAYEMQMRARLRELHALAAEAIEQVYGTDLAPHYPDLVYHYRHAENAERERHYARLAGEQAAAQFANADAVAFFSRALDLTPETDLAGRYALVLARERVHGVQGTREAQMEDLETLKELADVLEDDGRRAEVALRQANLAEVTSDYPAAIAAAQMAIDLAQTAHDLSNEAAGHLIWGQALWRQANHATALGQLEHALVLAQAAQVLGVEADALRNLGIVSHFLGDYARSKAYLERALRIYREIGNRWGESGSLNNLAIISTNQGDYAGATVYFEQALRIRREMGARRGEASLLGNLGGHSIQQGDYAAARGYFEKALRIYRETGDRWGESQTLNNLGLASADQGDYDGARAYLDQALSIKRNIGDRQGEALGLGSLGHFYLRLGDYSKAEGYYRNALYILREISDRRFEGMVLAHLSQLFHYLGDDEAALEYGQQALLVAQDRDDHSNQAGALTRLGHALTGLGNLPEAANAYSQALALRRKLGEPHLATEPLAGLARVFLAQGDLLQVQTQVEEILSYLKTGTVDGTEDPCQIYLTCYRVLQANEDPRAQDILMIAHTLLQERAAKISDEEMRRSFLENVAAHREILDEYAKGE